MGSSYTGGAGPWIKPKSTRAQNRPLERRSFDQLFVTFVLPVHVGPDDFLHSFLERDVLLVLVRLVVSNGKKLQVRVLT